MRAALLALCLVFPVQAFAQDAAAPTTLDVGWFNTPGAKTLERDYREFLDILPGLYDNQEQVYFDDNLEVDPGERHKRGTHIVTLTDNGGLNVPDSPMQFDKPSISFNTPNGERTPATVTPTRDAIALTIGEGCRFIIRRDNAQFSGTGAGSCIGETMSLSPEALQISANIDSLSAGHFRRARLFKCWISPRKSDGSYGFYNDVILHDQGGRAWLSGNDHPRVGVQMRNVVWPTGRNRPSLVLYAYRGEDEDKAVSYTWTGPDVDRLAINLRWMQASCTLDDETNILERYLKQETKK